MTRIIGGDARGRRLRTPRGDTTRPTADRVREALFSAVEARLGSLAGLRFLDLYAGSGAVALEALSRGASAATAVESDRRAAAVIRANAETVGVDLDVRVASVAATLSAPPAAAFDVAFADPPYPLPDDDLVDVLARLAEHAWLRPGGLLVVERSARGAEPPWPAGLVRERSRDYGETVLWYVRADPHD